MIHQKPYEAGNVFGHTYDFERVGDALQTHSHDHVMAHNCIVLRGAVEILGKVYLAGEIVDFDWSQPHSIKAVQKFSKTLHLYIHGKPEEYEGLTADQLSGTIVTKGEQL